MYNYIFLALIIILFILICKKKEHFKTEKKKCLIGIVGLYRTFEKTSTNIYNNIINSNKNYDFTIVINTDLENVDLKKERDKKYKKIIYTKNILEKKFKKCYGKFGNLKKITYYNNNSKYTSGLFKLRINKIIDIEDKDYDVCIFIRPDVIINKPLNIDKFIDKRKIYTITNKPKKTKENIRYDNKGDWDYILIGKYKSVLKYIQPIELKYKKLNKDDVVKLGKLNGNSGLFFNNYKKGITKFNMKENSLWVEKWWLYLINLYKNHNIILSFKNPQNINSKILRNYEDIKNINKF